MSETKDKPDAKNGNKAGSDDQQPPREDGARRYPQRQAQQPPASKNDENNGGEQKRKPRWGFIILGIVVVIGAVLGVLYWLAHRNLVETDDAFTDGNVVTVAPRVAGRVESLNVTDNQHVAAGQLLIHIDPRDFIVARDQAAADLAAVAAQINSARANLDITRVTEPARLAQAQAQLASARANEVKAQRDNARFHAVNPAATTRQDVDAATATLRQASAQVAQAQAAVNQASTVDLSIRQAETQIHQLQAQAAQAQAKLDQANLNLGYTDLRAPQPGAIARRNVDAGNYVQVGQTIFSLVTNQIWVTANFKEDQLARMRPGQHVTIAVDAYPSLKLQGHVDSVQLGSGSKFSAFPAENATGNFVKIVQRVPVKIVIDSGLDPNMPLPLGISVEPTVHVQ